MKAVCFGRLNVPTAGVLKLGQTTLGASMTTADAALTVVSASPFCADMIPFKLDIEPTSARRETVIVKNISGTTFTVQRGADGTEPYSHPTGSLLVARFPFAGWELGNVSGLAGKMYWGKSGMTPGGAGTIAEFTPNPSASVSADRHSFLSTDAAGNPLNLTDYALGAAVGGEGLYVTLWEK